MKIAAALALLAASASAYQPPTMTFAVGKKKPAAVKPAPAAAKPAPAAAKPAAKAVAAKPAAKAVAAKPAAKAVAAKPAAKKAATKAATKAVPVKPKSATVPSKALPFENAPATLDGTLPGDVGFDPCFLSTKQADLMAGYFNGLFPESNVKLDGLSWYRESELIHGRIAQLAVLGCIFPGIAHFPGDEVVGLDAFSYTNPLEAPSHIPYIGTIQILAFMVCLEFRRIRIIQREGSAYQPGDFKWGQGEGRWNPFGLNYSDDEYFQKQVQETKHGRLAMIAFWGLIFQANASGVGVLDQLAPAFSAPEYAAKAGYFLPEGI